MIFRASEPSTPRGDKPNREIILALLAMSFLVAVMIHYSRSLWCDAVPRLCIPDRISEKNEPANEDGLDRPRPGGVAPGSQGFSGSDDTGSPGINGGIGDRSLSTEPAKTKSAALASPTSAPISTAQRSFPSTATPRPLATALATRAFAGGNASPASPTSSNSDPGAGSGAEASATPRATEDNGGSSGDDGYPAPGSTRFPTRTPSPTPEGYPGP